MFPVIKPQSAPMDVEEQERIYGVPIFLNFINTGSSQLKTGSRKYEQDTPLPTFRSISINTELDVINIEIRM